MKRSTRKPREERGVETVAMLFVIPVMVILVLALIDVGMMFRARMLVENIYRDAARGAAADGGNYNDRTNALGESWEHWAYKRLVDENNKCRVAACKPGAPLPTIECNTITSVTGVTYTAEVVDYAGDLITCQGHYPYKPINGALLNGPLGLGFGNLLKEFDISVSARAETGRCSAFAGGC